MFANMAVVENVLVGRTGDDPPAGRQNAAIPLSVARRGCALETGSVVLSGPAADRSEHPDVRRAYLGEVA